MVVTACRRRGGSLSRRSGSFRLGGTLKPNLKCESDLKPVLRHREMLSDPRSAIKAPQAQNDDRWRRPGQGRSPPAPAPGPRSKAQLSSRTPRSGIRAPHEVLGQKTRMRPHAAVREDSDAASRRCPRTLEAGASRRARSRPRQAAPPAENHVPAFAKGADGSVVWLDSRSMRKARPFRRPGLG